MPGSEMTVIDTSIIVSVLRNETQDNRAQRARYVLDYERKNLVLPTLAVLESVAQSRFLYSKNPDESERSKAADLVLQKIAAMQLKTADFSVKISRRAARLIPKCNIKAPDAIIVATAFTFGLGKVYTWDRKLINACKKISSQVKVTEPPEIPLLP